MRNLTIEVYWEKVVDDKDAPLGMKVLKGDYERKSVTTYTGGGYETHKAFRKRMKSSKGFIELLAPNKAKMDIGTAWGIHSYQTVENWPA